MTDTTIDAGTLAARAAELLAELAGEDARLREDQLAAVDALVRGRRRVLVVQRTGWGKSAVYFLATRLLREAGGGPTLLVSPLLALMRDQIAAAARIGVRAETINSSNTDAWDEVVARITADEVDVLLISPERLNAVDFRDVLTDLAERVGMLVVDEAHCISDWGHDFRPDYRRITDVLARLGPDVPVLATTATANDRVTADVAAQLGAEPLTLRGTLDRESLRLSVRHLPGPSARLAWLADWIPRQPGSGIVYCLTVADTDRVADWLASRDITAAAYSGKTDPDERERIEAALKANAVKCVVATSALGMGYDKPDLRFVVHLGMPSSPIAYYQAIGRAGRAVDSAEAVLLPTESDEAVWGYFERTALPPRAQVEQVLTTLRSAGGPVARPSLERAVNLSRGRLDAMLKVLDVDGAVRRVRGGWEATDVTWEPDERRLARVTAARRAEQEAMRTYASTGACLMAFLRRELDDAAATDCGRCANCLPGDPPVDAPGPVAAAADQFLRQIDAPILPRRQWPSGLDGRRGNIKPELRADEGRALAGGRGSGWDEVLEALLDEAFDPSTQGGAAALDEAVDGLVAVLARWPWAQRPSWVCPMPSRRRAAVVDTVAGRLAALGKLELHRALRRDDTGRRFAEEMDNSTHRARNALAGLRADGPVPTGAVLLVDDAVRSGWTVTAAAAVLREAGSGPVVPLALLREP